MALNFRVEKATKSHLAGGLRSLAFGAFSIGIAAQPLSAADFSHSQKVYVPASSYDRRVDFSAIREQYTVPAPAKSSSSTAKKAGSSAAKSKTGSNSTAKSTTAGAPVRTVVKESTPPPPALNGKVASGQSLSTIARSLGAKLPPSTIAKMKQTAIDLQKSGKLDEAQRVLTKIAQMSPEDKANLQQIANIGVQRARNYLKSDNFHDALLAARQALAASPDDPAAHSVLNQLYQKVGADPNDINNRLKTAHALYEQGRFHEAEVEYKASLAVKPTPEAHVGLGKVSEKLYGAGSGKAHFEHALEVDSNHGTAHRELGVSHLHKGDLVLANSELSRALILNPGDKEASQHLTKLWQSQVAKIPNANSHLGLARAYQLSGDLPAAQSEYREVVRLDPNHPYLPAARQSFKIALAKQEAEKSAAAARTLESQGLVAEANQKIAEAVAYSPGNSGYKIYQGELLEKLGQPAQAKQVYLNVLKDDPQNITAAQKIKQLPNIAAAGLSAAGLAQSLLPGGMTGPAMHPTGFPGTKFPTTMLDNSLAATAAGGAPIDHVGALSGFMSDLRNHMLVQNEKNKKFEDTASKVIKKLTDPGTDEAPAAAGGAESDDDIIKKILSSPSPNAETAPAAAAESGASAALASAAAALAAAKGTGSASAAQTPVALSAGPALSAKSTAKASSSPALKPASSSANRLAELERQNKQLQDQLKNLKTAPQSNAAPALSQMPNNNSAFVPPQQFLPPQQFAPPGNFAVSQAPGFAAPTGFPAPSSAPLQSMMPPNLSQMYAPPQGEALSNSLPPIASNFPAGNIAPQFNPMQFASPINNGFNPAQFPQQAGSGFASAPGIAAAGAPQGFLDDSSGFQFQPPAKSANLRGPIDSSQGLKFELKNIKPTLKDVQLKVSLRNDGNAAMNLPENLQAIIKYPNNTESELKVAFDSKHIPAHGTIDGVVKVPFSKVDPTADLVLRNLLPQNQELHIIKTAITQNPM